jgi:hypothetical protein
MDRTVAKYSSQEEADKANREYYRGLTPQQRIDILLEIIEQARPEGDTERLERVYRIVKFSETSR